MKKKRGNILQQERAGGAKRKATKISSDLNLGIEGTSGTMSTNSQGKSKRQKGKGIANGQQHLDDRSEALETSIKPVKEGMFASACLIHRAHGLTFVKQATYLCEQAFHASDDFPGCMHASPTRSRQLHAAMCSTQLLCLRSPALLGQMPASQQERKLGVAAQLWIDRLQRQSGKY